MTVQSMGRYASRGTMMGVRAGYREVRTGAGRAKMMEYKVNNGQVTTVMMTMYRKHTKWPTFIQFHVQYDICKNWYSS